MQGPFSELVAAAKAGGRQARSRLLQPYRGLLARRVRERLTPQLRRHYDTDDLVNSVFTDALRELDRFEDRGEPAFRHWLCIKAESAVRMRRRRLTFANGVRREVSGPSHEGSLAVAPVAGPATQCERDDQVVQLERAMERLCPEQRVILRLRGAQGHTFAQIARHLGLAGADAARMRYARSLRALRRSWPAT